MKKMKSLAGKWTEKAIYGEKGIDIRCRVVLLQSLRQKLAEMGEIPPAEHDGVTVNFIKGTLPTDFGERFLKYPAWLTVVLGALFIFFLPREIESAILSIHSSLGRPLAYVALFIQWLAFYVVMSALAAGIVSLVAFLVYSKRLSKPCPLSFEAVPAVTVDPGRAEAPRMDRDETAFEIVREAILQGMSIASTVAGEIKGFEPDNIRSEWALEFTLAKCAVLSVRAEELTDVRLKTALFREIDQYVRHRATLDPTVPFAFQSYGQAVRENDAPSFEFAYSMGSLFRARLAKTLLALPNVGEISTDSERTDNERFVSQTIAADYCWPLKNQTEASVFGTVIEAEPSPEAKKATANAYMAAAERAAVELPQKLGRQPTFDEVMKRIDEIMVGAGYSRRDRTFGFNGGDRKG